ncbi:hypothetical protein SAMD00019534_089760 [Acytostelium subglobosum LB1]|uniref:hypothetical protein n=1 Tax=Acytostelium subglobosum LB1 TaxID=1410327 RepID=UPI000644D49E|nr:hypothetical protein SAMD00019534_089760 [Acytostelium subglobosum LB1]GAM25801.1 hypothetical protein SAMD00019534_089760 [Acytostelium subglobosum LB1]|eukprot:XP_012751319.1 hypothetical protein SAMD00019534_089760 [Acytostelium subglobosum LB1]
MIEWLQSTANTTTSIIGTPIQQQHGGSTQQANAAPNGGAVHPLANSFFFFYMPKRPKNTSDYLNDLQMITGPVNTVETFWSYYSHMIRPVDEFSTLSDIYLFKEGIRPVWEDPENQNGGKFVIKVRRNFTSKWWEDLLLAFVGEQIEGGDSINGIVISFRSADNSLIGIWNKDCNDDESKEKIAASLRNLFRIEKVDYKPHHYRMRDGTKEAGDETLTNGHGGLSSSLDMADASGAAFLKQHQSAAGTATTNVVVGSLQQSPQHNLYSLYQTTTPSSTTTALNRGGDV